MVNLTAEHNRTLREGCKELRVAELRRCANEILEWLKSNSADRAEDQVRETVAALDRVQRVEETLHAQMGVHNGT